MRFAYFLGRSERMRHGSLVLGLPVAALVLAHLFFTPRFQSNDDVGMNLIAAGVMLSPSPCGHVLYMNRLLGEPLSLLHVHYPQVPWYFLFMQGSLLLASCAITDAVLSRGPSYLRLLGLTAFLTFVGIPFFVLMQFTQVAALSACAAILVWHSRGSERPWTAGSVTLAIGLVVLGAVVRHDSCIMVGLLAVPLIGLEAGSRFIADRRCETELSWRQPWRSTGMRSLALLALGVCVGGACVTTHKVIEHYDVAWREFPTYNFYRGKFNDFGAVPYNAATKPAFDRVGWSKNDYDMLLLFFWADREVYSIANYRAILEACPPNPAPARSLRTQYPLLKAQIDSVPFKPLLAAVLFPAFLLPRSKLGWAKYLGTALAWIAVWYYLLVLVNRCPPYVLYSMMAFVAAVGLGAAAAHADEGRLSWGGLAWRLLVFAVLIGVALPGFRILRGASKLAVAQDRSVREQVRRLDPRPNQLFVTWASSFPYEKILTQRGFDGLRDFKMFPFSCCTNTPICDERLREFGITDLMTAIYQRDDVFLIATDDLAGLLVTFIREHRGVETQFSRTFDGPHFTVYQFSRVPPN